MTVAPELNVRYAAQDSPREAEASMSRTLGHALLLLSLTIALGCQRHEESKVSADLARQVLDQWTRVQTEFQIVQQLDAGQYPEAEAQFRANRVPSSMTDQVIADLLTQHKYLEARDAINGQINGWIIQEAGHAQNPPLSVLLNNPARLQFLKKLAAHREKFPPKTPEGRASDALVANILLRAVAPTPASPG